MSINYHHWKSQIICMNLIIVRNCCTVNEDKLKNKTKENNDFLKFIKTDTGYSCPEKRDFQSLMVLF